MSVDAFNPVRSGESALAAGYNFNREVLGQGNPRFLIAATIKDPLVRSRYEQNLNSALGATVDYRPGLSREQLIEEISSYDGLIARSTPLVDTSILNQALSLKIVGRAGNGLDNIDLETATEMGIYVVNSPDASIVPVAELTIGFMIAAARKIPQSHGELVEGEWSPKLDDGMQLSGQTLGIIGLGRIGKAVAKRAIGMEMNVIAYDPYPPSEDTARALGVVMMPFEDVLRISKVITLHTTPEGNYHLINKDTLALMEQKPLFINPARGELVDEEALYRALVEGQIAGAALDVFEHEKEKRIHPGLVALAKKGRVVLTQHIGAATQEAQLEIADDISRKFVAAFRGEPFRAVNNPVKRVAQN